MKQRIFTLLMMFALVFVAGSAMAQVYNVKSVYAGSTNYHYRVTGVSVNGAATINVTVPTGASFHGLSPASFAASASNQTITFDVDYGTSAASGDIILEVNETGGCSNYITLSIAVTTPSLTLAIATTNINCQAVNNHPADGNDGTVGQSNTVTYTFTLGTAPAGLESYTYTYAETANAQLDITASSVSKTNVADETVVFDTKEGAATSVQATISAGTFKMDSDHGGGTYNITINGVSDGSGTQTATSNVYALPTIGAFN